MEDRYAEAGYAQGAATETPRPPFLYTAFAVIEHFAHPRSDLDALFASRPDSILVTTALYEGQGPEWWYLAPASGQHVFFYSARAMELIGERFGYSVQFLGNYTLFDSQRRSGASRALARLLLNNVSLRLIRSLLMLMPARGAVRDFERLTDGRLP